MLEEERLQLPGDQDEAGNASSNCISVLVAAIVATAGKVATEHLIAIAGSTRGSMFSCRVI